MTKVISKPDATVGTSVVTSPAARLSLAAGAASVLFLAILHVLSPEFDPSWRMVSEYALGNFKWVLTLMFLSQALGSLALFFAIKSQIRTAGGKIGLFFLITASIGLTMASIFDWTHNLHGLSTLIGIPSFPLASMILSISLGRQQTWSTSRKLLLVTANLVWISLVWMQFMLFTGLAQTGGQFGPEVLIGWPNRIVITTYSVWLMAVASQAAKLKGSEL